MNRRWRYLISQGPYLGFEGGGFVLAREIDFGPDSLNFFPGSGLAKYFEQFCPRSIVGAAPVLVVEDVVSTIN